MIRVSTRARYALRMMLDIAKHDGEHAPVSLTRVAERTDVSRGYLEQVALSLRSARLLRGVSGRRGGYLLTAPTDQITVGRIFEALLGPICMVDCVTDPGSCPRTEHCECRLIYQMMNERVVDVLQGNTLADLLDPNWVRAHGGRVLAEEENGDAPEGSGPDPNPREPNEGPGC